MKTKAAPIITPYATPEEGKLPGVTHAPHPDRQYTVRVRTPSTDAWQKVGRAITMSDGRISITFDAGIPNPLSVVAITLDYVGVEP